MAIAPFFELKQGAAADVPTPDAGYLRIFLDTSDGALKVKNSAGTVAALGAVLSVFARSGAVVATSGDYSVAQVTGAAPLASPTFTGTPAAPTASPGVNTTQIATTAFVAAAIAALINSAPGALDTLEELADALGDDANFAATMTTALALKAPLASPALTGSPTAPTKTAGDNSTNLATTAYADAAATAAAANAVTSWKHRVRAATTANGTLASAFANAQVIDGVTLATGDRILLKNQTTGTENGIYVVAASGAPSRATDADSGAEFVGAAVFVSEGTTNKNTAWQCTNASVTLGATAITFTAFAGPTGVGAGSVGSGGSVPVITYSADGRITGVTSAPIVGGGGAITGTVSIFDPDKPESSPSALDTDYDSNTIPGTVVNHSSTATIDAHTSKLRHLFISVPASDGDNLRCDMFTIPAGDFAVQTHLKVLDSRTDYPYLGLLAADGVTYGAGKQELFAVKRQTTAWQATRLGWTNYSANNGVESAGDPVDYGTFIELFMRLERSGTTITHRVSRDGEVWSLVAAAVTEATLGFTITRIGPCARNSSASGALVVAFKNFRYHATPAHQFGGDRAFAYV